MSTEQTVGESKVWNNDVLYMAPDPVAEKLELLLKESDEKTYTIAEFLTAATRANHVIQQWVPQNWIDALLKALKEP